MLEKENINIKMRNAYRIFEILLSGVFKRISLGPILFNIFMGDLYLSIKRSELHNSGFPTGPSVMGEVVHGPPTGGDPLL